jgi:hypothetical protein
VIYEIVNKPKKIEAALLDRAVSFSCNYLELEVDFILIFKSLRNNLYGHCDYDDAEIIITIATRLSPDNIIRTLFHELAHVKQYTSGHREEGMANFWMGNSFYGPYENLPWEVEAFEIEEKIMKAFNG